MDEFDVSLGILSDSHIFNNSFLESSRIDSNFLERSESRKSISLLKESIIRRGSYSIESTEKHRSIFSNITNVIDPHTSDFTVPDKRIIKDLSYHSSSLHHSMLSPVKAFGVHKTILQEEDAAYTSDDSLGLLSYCHLPQTSFLESPAFNNSKLVTPASSNNILFKNFSSRENTKCKRSLSLYNMNSTFDFEIPEVPSMPIPGVFNLEPIKNDPPDLESSDKLNSTFELVNTNGPDECNKENSSGLDDLIRRYKDLCSRLVDTFDNSTQPSAKQLNSTFDMVLGKDESIPVDKPLLKTPQLKTSRGRPSLINEDTHAINATPKPLNVTFEKFLNESAVISKTCVNVVGLGDEQTTSSDGSQMIHSDVIVEHKPVNITYENVTSNPEVISTTYDKLVLPDDSLTVSSNLTNLPIVKQLNTTFDMLLEKDENILLDKPLLDSPIVKTSCGHPSLIHAEANVLNVESKPLNTTYEKVTCDPEVISTTFDKVVLPDDVLTASNNLKHLVSDENSKIVSTSEQPKILDTFALETNDCNFAPKLSSTFTDVNDSGVVKGSALSNTQAKSVSKPKVIMKETPLPMPKKISSGLMKNRPMAGGKPVPRSSVTVSSKMGGPKVPLKADIPIEKMIKVKDVPVKKAPVCLANTKRTTSFSLDRSLNSSTGLSDSFIKTQPIAVSTPRSHKTTKLNEHVNTEEIYPVQTVFPRDISFKSKRTVNDSQMPQPTIKKSCLPVKESLKRKTAIPSLKKSSMTPVNPKPQLQCSTVSSAKTKEILKRNR